MSLTSDQMKDHIIDQIIKLIMQNRYEPYFYNQKFQLDLAYYRKIVSDSGYIKKSEDLELNDDTKSVIYQEDYQKSNDDIDVFITKVSQCYETGYVNEYGDKTYNQPPDWVDSGEWIFYNNGFSTDPCDENISECEDEFGNAIAGMPYPGSTGQISINIANCPDGLGGHTTLTEYLDILTPSADAYSDGDETPVLDYLSQLVGLENQKSIIDSVEAAEVLDTTIYELLPGIQTRQERVDRLFSEFNDLLSPNTPQFNLDGVPGVDDNWDIGGNLGTDSNIYSDTFDISKLGPNAGYITRLARHAVNENENQSLEELRNRINPYLEDIDEIIDPVEDDERIDYSDISEGYIKFRGLNQSIIIRSENDNTGLEDYQTDGFSIAMWVRFIDKKSGGTLFNYGNPLGNGSDYGFVLETFVVGEDEQDGNNSTFGASYPQLFADTSHARFIRLVVNDKGTIYNSHIGLNGIDRQTAPTLPQAFNKSIGGDGVSTTPQILGYTPVPVNRNEWYFIVANFNPLTQEVERIGVCNTGDMTSECSVDGVTPLKNDPDYWRWNVGIDESNAYYTQNSNSGAKCKVEIISKSDLLRARGYKI